MVGALLMRGGVPRPWQNGLWLQTAVIGADLPLMYIRGHKLRFDAAYRMNIHGSIPMKNFSGIMFRANCFYYDHHRKEVIHSGRHLRFVFSNYFSSWTQIGQAYLKASPRKTMPSRDDLVIVNENNQVIDETVALGSSG